jgi:hypothetical protein
VETECILKARMILQKKKKSEVLFIKNLKILKNFADQNAQKHWGIESAEF